MTDVLLLVALQLAGCSYTMESVKLGHLLPVHHVTSVSASIIRRPSLEHLSKAGCGGHGFQPSASAAEVCESNVSTHDAILSVVRWLSIHSSLLACLDERVWVIQSVDARACCRA
eukprot:5735005-Amphidinium_carterae.1